MLAEKEQKECVPSNNVGTVLLSLRQFIIIIQMLSAIVAVTILLPKYRYDSTVHF